MKREARNQSWYQGETVISGIGQGFWVTTPLQLAAATTAVARRGNFTPHFSLLEDLDAGAPVPIGKPLDWERMIDAMEGVLHEENGTARGAGQGLNYRIAGKTGTVQILVSDRKKSMTRLKLTKGCVITPYLLDLLQRMPQVLLLR